MDSPLISAQAVKPNPKEYTIVACLPFSNIIVVTYWLLPCCSSVGELFYNSQYVFCCNQKSFDSSKGDDKWKKLVLVF